ncbi:nucleotide exchange factor GrpE [Candidatus Saccharibacteria bacterium]|nr:nucleotide exchange factor GrpE [Candidatus Saccharibacteria bacterium]
MKKTVKENKDGSITEEYKFSGDDLKNVKVKVDASEIEKMVSELTADLQRTRADFENYRKQVEMQRNNAVKSAEMASVYKVLPLLDDVERAIFAYKELAPLAKSLEKTVKELGLEKIVADEGVEFNPDLHEAVMAEGDGEKEVISEVLRAGYNYNGDVLRPAMVKVKKI